jgi:hypothetical protein
VTLYGAGLQVPYELPFKGQRPQITFQRPHPEGGDYMITFHETGRLPCHIICLGIVMMI